MVDGNHVKNMTSEIELEKGNELGLQNYAVMGALAHSAGEITQTVVMNACNLLWQKDCFPAAFGLHLLTENIVIAIDPNSLKEDSEKEDSWQSKVSVVLHETAAEMCTSGTVIQLAAYWLASKALTYLVEKATKMHIECCSPNGNGHEHHGHSHSHGETLDSEKWGVWLIKGGIGLVASMGAGYAKGQYNEWLGLEDHHHHDHNYHHHHEHDLPNANFCPSNAPEGDYL